MASDPQSWNMYAYGRNNPLKYTDPTGLSYEICDANGKCSKEQLSDQEFEAQRKGAQANGEYFTNGKLYHFDSDGNRVNDGTYRQTDVDLPGDPETNRMAAAGIVTAFNQGMKEFGKNAAFAVAGAGIGLGLEAINDARLAQNAAAAAEGTTAVGNSTLQISKHAAQRMAERGFTRDMIEQTIKNGTRYWDPKNGTFNYVLRGGFASGKDALVGVNPVTNVVTTVLRGTANVGRMIPF